MLQRADRVDRRQDGDGISGKQRHVPHQILTASVVYLVEKPENVQKRRLLLRQDRQEKTERIQDEWIRLIE